MVASYEKNDTKYPKTALLTTYGYRECMFVSKVGPGVRPVTRVHSWLNMHLHGGVLNSLDNQCVEPAVVRVNFGALP